MSNKTAPSAEALAEMIRTWVPAEFHERVNNAIAALVAEPKAQAPADWEVAKDCLTSIKAQCEVQPSALAKAIVVTCERGLLALSTASEPKAQAIEVWFGSMPESNGRENWTLTLRRKDRPENAGKSDLHRLMSGVSVYRSEYKDRARYEADRLRFLLGEISEAPDIRAYDADLHSGYAEPEAQAQAAEPDPPWPVEAPFDPLKDEEFLEWACLWFGGDADENYLKRAFRDLSVRAYGVPVVELQEQVEQLTRALREATDGPTFMGEPAITPSPAARETAEPVAVVSDLSLLVMRMARRLSITEPGQVHVAGNKQLAQQATDYLKRKGLTSPLRDDAAPPAVEKPAPEPIAFVPVHPKNGPLWMDTYDAKRDVLEARTCRYPLMSLYTAPVSQAEPAALPTVEQRALRWMLQAMYKLADYTGALEDERRRLVAELNAAAQPWYSDGPTVGRGLELTSQAEPSTSRLQAAASQARFALRELLPNDPDAQMTVRMLDEALGAARASHEEKGRVPDEVFEIVQRAYDNIEPGALAENRQHTESIVQPYLDAIMDELRELDATPQGPTAREVARQAFALCEWMEETPHAPPTDDLSRQFQAGKAFAAKHIRNGVGNWLTDEENRVNRAARTKEKT